MKHIVIIDDSAMILKLTSAALEGSGYRVTAIDDPGEFNPDATGSVDLFLVDINMPQFYGDDIVTYFKEEWSLTTPIYMFSNVPEEELKRRAERCGANGYISKDWGLEALLKHVELIIGKPEA
jgi:DNA-binding response OmpR family regulator